MLRLVPTIARTATRCSAAPRAFSTVGTAFTAGDAAELSGYNKIDFCIDENASVLDAVKIFVANNIGCLVTTNNTGRYPIVVSCGICGRRRRFGKPFGSDLVVPTFLYYITYIKMFMLFLVSYVHAPGDLTGIISERDYISKVDLLDRNPEKTKVKDIFTPSSKLITAGRDESVQGCMEKMLASDIRHLPLVDHGELLGMISIKDLVKTCIKEQDQTIDFLSDFALGNLKRY